MRWHYSQRMPVGKLICHGVWEHGSFVGAIIYGRGAARTLGAAWGCDQTQCCELVRIALAPGRTVPTSRALSVSLRMLAKTNPGMQLVVSFADPAQGHVGTLYQATNWLYTGDTAPASQYFYKGRWCHLRDVTSGAFGKGGAVPGYRDMPKRATLPKHRYVFPLTNEVRKRVAALPYPKSLRAESIEAMRPASSRDRVVQVQPQRTKRNSNKEVSGGR